MGKKTLNRNKKENPPKRWDKIIGAVTLLTIVIFGFIIYNDYNGSSSKTASVNAEKNTVKQTESEKVTKAETDTKRIPTGRRFREIRQSVLMQLMAEAVREERPVIIQKRQ